MSTNSDLRLTLCTPGCQGGDWLPPSTALCTKDWLPTIYHSELLQRLDKIVDKKGPMSNVSALQILITELL